MNFLNKCITVFTLVSIVACVRFIKNSHNNESATCVIGTSADFPPFSFFDQNGTIIGFDIDLIKEVFSRLNREYRIENMPFETLLPQMQFGALDIIAAGMSPTPERAQRIFFSDPYLSADPLTIIKKVDNKKIESVNDLIGKQVAVNQGYVADMQLSKIKGIRLLKLPSIQDGLLALNHDKVDAFVTGARTIKPLLQIVGHAFEFIPINELTETTAFGVAKKRASLVPQINDALRQLQADGTLEKLKQKWNIE